MRSILYFKKLYTILLLSFLTISILAQQITPGIPYIRNYRQQETNNITQTWTLLQANTGIIYSGNGFGVSEFDGRNWRWMRISNNSSIYSLFEDIDGTIYMGAISEFGLLEASENGFLQYKSLNQLIPSGYRDFDVVWQITKFKHYVVFMSDYQMFFYDGKKIDVIRSGSKFQKILVQDGELYVYETVSGLNEVSESLSLRKIHFPGENAPLLNLVAMEAWEQDGILFCDISGKLFIYQNSILQAFENKASGFIAKARPYCVLKLKNSTYAVGTTLNGIVVFDQNGNIIQHVNRQSGLDNNKIHCIAEDKSGNLWVGHENGVSYIELNSPLRYLPHQIISGSGYSAKLVQNEIYFGTSEGVYKAKHSITNTGISINNPEIIIGTEGQVWNLDLINNELFIHQFNGLQRYKSGTLQQLSKSTGSWKIMEIPGHPNLLLQGTYEGLVLWENNGGNWVLSKKIEGFSESSRLFEIDKQNNVWVSHGFKGVFKVNLSEDFSKVNSVKFYGKAKGFPSNLGINVCKLGSNIYFTSEYGGIYYYNSEQDTFIEHKKFINYLGEKPELTRIFEDNQKNIWYVKKDQMGVLKKMDENNYFAISKPFSGLYNHLIGAFEFIFPIDENNVLFGVKNGYAVYNMKFDKDFNQSFHTFIRNVELIPSDSSVFGGYNSATSRKPEFSYQNHSVRFTFSAPFYEQTEGIKYSYYLEGFDDDWSLPSNANTKEYLKLNGGNYKFRVKAVNIYGIEGKEDVYEFYVHPHFTRTWWAYIIYVALGIAALLTFLYFYTKARERKHRRIALQKEKQIMELKHQKLLNEFEHKNSELSTLTLQVVKKNDVLNEIKQKLEHTLDKQGNDVKKDINSVVKILEHEISEDKDWEAIELYFNNVYKGFLKKLKEKYPELRSTELKMCAYIRMDLSNKEIAALMNNTIRGIEAYRYRLRKSLNLKREESLKEFLFNFE